MRNVLAAALALALVAAAPLWAQEAPKEGRPPYVVLPQPAERALPEGQPEVDLFFWYGCGGCRKVEKALARRPGWPKGATLLQRHVLSNDVVALQGRVFFALQAMGEPPATHLRVFQLVQDEGFRLMELDDVPALVKELGVDEKAFKAAFDSEAVAAKMDETARLSEAYGLELVPCLVVNGRYKFDLGQASGPEEFLDRAEELLAR